MENRIIAFEDFDVWRARAKAAVDRSDGQLREFAGRRFVNGISWKGVFSFII
jgi:hypothetical protein